MKDRSECHQIDINCTSIARELELTDLDADQQLLSLVGTSLLIFTSPGCAACRYARQQLPEFDLPIDRLAWVDAGANGGLVQRYEVYRLPALFLVRDGDFFGALPGSLQQASLLAAIEQALAQAGEELP